MDKKIIVGREKELEDFCSKYLMFMEEKNLVLHYYGVPGIGKTTFANMIYSMLVKNECLTIFYSMKQESKPSKINILLGLSKKLEGIEEGSIFSFPLFYTALTFYYMKLSGDNVDLFNKRYKSVSEKVPVLSDILNIVGSIGETAFIGTSVSSIFDKVVAMYRNFKLSIDKSKYSKELFDIERSNAEQIEKNINLFFIEDMKRNCQKIENRRIYFILDTYEIIKNTELENSDYYGDDWLRNSSKSLINSVPNSTWIFFGRNLLEWNDNYELNYEKERAIELLPLLS